MLLTGNRSWIRIVGFNAIEISTWFLIGCTLATLVNSQQHFYTNGRYGKRQDPSVERAASSFWSGSRYGRSGDSSLSDTNVNGIEEKSGRIGDDDSIKEVEISPRTDRFFLGSRYGKRTFSKNRRIDSTLKHFETSLDFLISFDHHMRTDDKQDQMKILDNELKEKNIVDLKLDDDFFDPLVDKNERSSLTRGNGFACLYTGVTNLYRCFHRFYSFFQSISMSSLITLNRIPTIFVLVSFLFSFVRC